jgi:hypothetical protein
MACTQAQSRSRCHVIVRAAAGGFGKSNKKKIDTEGGMVMPKKVFRTATLEDLKDDAPSKSSKSKAEDGAPAGFPEGMACSAYAVADQEVWA